MNLVVLMGRLTADPELKQTPNGLSVCSFTLAVDRAYSKDNKQTDFIQIVAWRQTAEFVSRYFSKGQLIAVQGFLQTRQWEDKEGKPHRAYEVVADKVHFTGDRRDGGNKPVAESYGQPQASNPAQLPVSSSDDDLPF